MYIVEEKSLKYFSVGRTFLYLRLLYSYLYNAWLNLESVCIGKFSHSLIYVDLCVMWQVTFIRLLLCFLFRNLYITVKWNLRPIKIYQIYLGGILLGSCFIDWCSISNKSTWWNGPQSEYNWCPSFIFSIKICIMIDYFKVVIIQIFIKNNHLTESHWPKAYSGISLILSNKTISIQRECRGKGCVTHMY